MFVLFRGARGGSLSRSRKIPVTIQGIMGGIFREKIILFLSNEVGLDKILSKSIFKTKKR